MNLAYVFCAFRCSAQDATSGLCLRSQDVKRLKRQHSLAKSRRQVWTLCVMWKELSLRARTLLLL